MLPLRDWRRLRRTISTARWRRLRHSWRASRTTRYLLYLQADILAQKGPEPGTPDFDRALASAKKAVSLQPALAAARGVLAKLQLQAGQYDAAIEQCRKALASDPKDQTALYRLIQALRKSGNRAEIPDLLKRLASLREEAAQEERDRYRYKLVVGEAPDTPASP